MAGRPDFTTGTTLAGRRLRPEQVDSKQTLKEAKALPPVRNECGG
jgi:hypothetical protein